MTDDALRFTRGCVATPHHLGSAAGARVLASGGNAVDAAVAANLVLAVVTPYHCGVGGDLVAIVHDGATSAVTSIGAAPQGATAGAIEAAIAAGHGSNRSQPHRNGMPADGALPVTVPGAVAGWFHLLEQFGSQSFGTVATEAIRIAEDGFVVSPHGAAHVEASRQFLGHRDDWVGMFGAMMPDRRFVQPDLAASLKTLANDGPNAFYRGSIGHRIVEVLGEQGSTMSMDDLTAHEVLQPTPIEGTFRGRRVVELPPPSQGVTALTALGILDRFDPTDDRILASHLAIEASRAAYAERELHLADLGRGLMPAGHTATSLDEIAATIDPERAVPDRIASAMQGGTVYFAAADADGLSISLSQSNFKAFGSGVAVEGTGIGLHNRGAHFTLEHGHPNAIAPGKRPMHTLIPAMVFDGDRLDYIIGTMGGDAQVVIQVQLLASLIDRGLDVRSAVEEPRWLIELGADVVQVEGLADHAVVDAWATLGHRTEWIADRDHRAGHAQIIQVLDDGFAAAADPRAEGFAAGW
ncbi:MAG: gamma-glutamyltransferase [Nitriliruptoraceae bacterium]